MANNLHSSFVFCLKFFLGLFWRRSQRCVPLHFFLKIKNSLWFSIQEIWELPLPPPIFYWLRAWQAGIYIRDVARNMVSGGREAKVWGNFWKLRDFSLKTINFFPLRELSRQVIYQTIGKIKFYYDYHIMIIVKYTRSTLHWYMMPSFYWSICLFPRVFFVNDRIFWIFSLAWFACIFINSTSFSFGNTHTFGMIPNRAIIAAYHKNGIIPKSFYIKKIQWYMIINRDSQIQCFSSLSTFSFLLPFFCAFLLIFFK